MRMQAVCECGNSDTLLIGNTTTTDKVIASVDAEVNKPIYLWSDTPGVIMIKCLACNKEYET